MKKMNYTFSVPDNKRVRMIVSTDCKNEADDQFALAHHLMTPMFILKGIVPCHFNMFSRDYGDGHTAQASMDEVNKVLDLMDRQGVCPVCKGSEFPMKDEQTPAVSDGAKLIAEEAMKDDPHPLFIACQGALTDVASALLMKPEIAEHDRHLDRRSTVSGRGRRVQPPPGYRSCKRCDEIRHEGMAGSVYRIQESNSFSCRAAA